MQNWAIFCTWLSSQFLNLDNFLVSVNLLHMLLSFRLISFDVQCYKYRQVGFILIVMNQVYKSLKSAIVQIF